MYQNNGQQQEKVNYLYTTWLGFKYIKQKNQIKMYMYSMTLFVYEVQQKKRWIYNDRKKKNTV